ncbi:helix-turn-helix domain-containing protein [Bacillus mycoides]|uniref:helix-turn-helix domain-containing protein n=1 Tax=Bacillus mycoides TaxID=1405 RepID=UPI002112416E|nr:helix-turn-helix transcriptional regulator [Bacillus mycoides]MCQ6529873.1 helix-turn-helix transcriptional regulator [Bacillus mycoides]
MILTIRQVRLAKGIKQTAVAEQLNVHVDTYRKMERNPDDITIGEAKKICNFLEISYDHIFFNDNSTLSRVESGGTLEM